MKRSLKLLRFVACFAAVMACLTSSAGAYVAYPALAAGGSNAGLVTGALVGYTVLGADGVTVIAVRATAGISDLGGGNYVVPAGVTVPDGLSTVLGAAPTQQSDIAGSIKATALTIPTTAFNPSYIPNMAFRFEPSVGGGYTDGSAGTAGTTAVADTGLIQTLTDLSGNGYIAYEATNKPTYQVAASHLGAPDMLFTAASNTTLSFGHPAALENLASSGYTIFMTVYVGTGSASAVLCKGVLGGDTANAFLITSNIFERYSSGSPLTGPGYPTSPATCGVGTKHILVYRYTPILNGSYATPVIWEEIYVDGRIALRREAQAPNWQSSGNWRIGSSDSAGYSFFGEIGNITGYARALTDLEVQEIDAFYAQKFGVSCYSPVTQPKVEAITTNVVASGNSLTYGATTATAPVNPYPTQLARLLPANVQIFNLGISGTTTTTLTGYAASREDLLYDPARNNIDIVWELTNDYAQTNNTPTQVYNNMVAFCTARKAAGYRVILVTMIPRGGGYTNTAITGAGTLAQQQAACEAGRVTINSLFRADFASGPPAYADAILDLGNGGTITLNGQSFDTSPLGTYSNTTYFATDSIHLVQAGYKVAATGAALAVQQLMATLNSGVLFGGDHTKITTDSQAGLTGLGYTNARATKIDGIGSSSYPQPHR
jgi:hypothetical protein